MKFEEFVSKCRQKGLTKFQIYIYCIMIHFISKYYLQGCEGRGVSFLDNYELWCQKLKNKQTSFLITIAYIEGLIRRKNKQN